MEQFTLTDEKQAKKMGFLQMCIIVVLFSYGSPYPTNKNKTVLEKSKRKLLEICVVLKIRFYKNSDFRAIQDFLDILDMS